MHADRIGAEYGGGGSAEVLATDHPYWSPVDEAQCPEPTGDDIEAEPDPLVGLVRAFMFDMTPRKAGKLFTVLIVLFDPLYVDRTGKELAALAGVAPRTFDRHKADLREVLRRVGLGI